MVGQNTCTIKKNIKRLLLICIAAVLFAANVKTFVHAGNLLPGGFTGLTLLIQQIMLHSFPVLPSLRRTYSPT